MLRYYLYSGFAIIGTFSVVGFILGFRKLSSFRCKSGFVCFRPNSISASHNNDSYRLAKTCRITGKHKAKLLELESLNQVLYEAKLSLVEKKLTAFKSTIAPQLKTSPFEHFFIVYQKKEKHLFACTQSLSLILIKVSYTSRSSLKI